MIIDSKRIYVKLERPDACVAVFMEGSCPGPPYRQVSRLIVAPTPPTPAASAGLEGSDQAVTAAA
jgi:hypothetical protein